MTPAKKKNTDIIISPSKPIDSLKYNYLEKLVKMSIEDGAKFAFAISPSFEMGVDEEDYVPIFELCKRYGIPFINNKNCQAIAGKIELFQDKKHLNNAGAIEYSRIVAHQLKRYRLRLREADMKQDVVLPPHE